MTTFDARPHAAAAGARQPEWLASVLLGGLPTPCDAVFPFHGLVEPACVSSARRFVDHTLTGWGSDGVAFEAQLVVSELVTNAMRHGGGIDELRLLAYGAELACVVTDRSPAAPVAVRPDVFAEFGRGLRLVEAICTTWGWVVSSTRRKLVWAVLAA
ncbi:ATP-binding protein [Nonomuraea sp. SMC257]|uniref:ATP-binding protein n=1 Tax=Nonomuraea montanisoli TaxID=2741721 RepID=A0A7Y6I3S9_9ACTN|nr:ATP-binding protein [Nonomuraea montanisoli]NUW31016.1 ATP-binding protein [Nonomuraea montanisoli]